MNEVQDKVQQFVIIDGKWAELENDPLETLDDVSDDVMEEHGIVAEAISVEHLGEIVETEDGFTIQRANPDSEDPWLWSPMLSEGPGFSSSGAMAWPDGAEVRFRSVWKDETD